MSSKPRWLVFEDGSALANAAAERVLRLADASIQQRGAFKLVLSGGSTPQAVYRLLADAAADWSRWHIYFGDERCLHPCDQDRNSQMAAAAWLGSVAIPPGQVHVIPAELGAKVAAERYAATIAPVMPFDLVLLGLGEDGHTASLFPGHPLDGALVLPVLDAPKPPAERVSLSIDALVSARNLLFLVTGEGKRQAVREWIQSADSPAATVAARQASAWVMVDRSAWQGSG